MNKLLSLPGGQELRLDDLIIIQDGHLKGFEAILNAVGNCIISGCETSVFGGNISLTAGFVAIDSEIYEVPPQTISFSDPNLINYYITPLIQTASPRLFQASASSQNVHEIRTGQLIISQSIPPSGVSVSAKSLLELLTAAPDARLDNIEAPWVSVSVGFFNDQGGVIPGASTAKYKIIGKTLIFHFEAEGTFPTTSRLRVRLPNQIIVAGGVNPEFSAVQSAYLVKSATEVEILPAFCNVAPYAATEFTVVGNIAEGLNKLYATWTLELI